MKPLIIGEAPSKNEVTERPIEGRVAARLSVCSGLKLPEFLTFFDRTNLLHVRQDTAPHGFQFDKRAARLAADEIRKSFDGPDRIVLLLGHRVAEAFDIKELEYFVQHQVGNADVRVLPHPSGINRWWNEPKNMDDASRLMRTIVSRVRGW